MPYVTKDRKAKLLAEETPANAGELNYVLTMVICDYAVTHGISYLTINDISGALTEALAEFRRRIGVPYEEYKAAVNGDVYGPAISALREAMQR